MKANAVPAFEDVGIFSQMTFSSAQSISVLVPYTPSCLLFWTVLLQGKGKSRSWFRRPGAGRYAGWDRLKKQKGRKAENLLGRLELIIPHGYQFLYIFKQIPAVTLQCDLYAACKEHYTLYTRPWKIYSEADKSAAKLEINISHKKKKSHEVSKKPPCCFSFIHDFCNCCFALETVQKQTELRALKYTSFTNRHIVGCICLKSNMPSWTGTSEHAFPHSRSGYRQITLENSRKGFTLFLDLN